MFTIGLMMMAITLLQPLPAQGEEGAKDIPVAFHGAWGRVWPGDYDPCAGLLDNGDVNEKWQGLRISARQIIHHQNETYRVSSVTLAGEDEIIVEEQNSMETFNNTLKFKNGYLYDEEGRYRRCDQKKEL